MVAESTATLETATPNQKFQQLTRAMLEVLNVRYQLGAQNYTARSWADTAGEMTNFMAGVRGPVVEAIPGRLAEATAN